MSPTTRIYAIASGAAVVAVLAGGWFVGVQPQLDATATALTNEAAVTAQNKATEIKLAALSKVAAKQDVLEEEADVLNRSVPTILKPNRLIRRVNEVAAWNGVTVLSVAPGEAAAYAAPASAAGATADTGGVPAPALAKTSPLITAGNFAVIPMSVVVTGERAALLQFAHDIANDQRTYTITGLQLSKNDDISGYSLSLNGDVYTLAR
jgi:Tfp pilus assembly protein PilO